MRDTLATPSTSDDRSYVYFHDGAGNVGQLLEVTGASANPNFGTLAARYEYDAYGNNLLDPGNTTQSGPYAATNPFRFSTKWHDAQTGLSYFGYRYFSPTWGRWINRDPLGVAGGTNLYQTTLNSPTNFVDAFGLEVGELTQEERAQFPTGTGFFTKPGDKSHCLAHVYSSSGDWLGTVEFACAKGKCNEVGDAALIAQRMAKSASIKNLAQDITDAGEAIKTGVRVAIPPLDSAMSAVEFAYDPSLGKFVQIAAPIAGGTLASRAGKYVDDIAGEAGVASRAGRSNRATKLAGNAGKECPCPLPRAPPANLKPYGGKGGGHHIPAKSAFRSSAGYDENLALAVPNDELERLGVKHAVVSGAQVSLYSAFAKSGAPLTWDAIRDIEVNALVAAKLDRSIAESTVDAAIHPLRASGIAPTHTPWGAP